MTTAARRRFLANATTMLRQQPDEALFDLLEAAQADGDVLLAAMIETEIDARTEPDVSPLQRIMLRTRRTV